MYPAIEIDLHLDRVCAAQGQSSAAAEAAFRVSTCGTNLLPPHHGRGTDSGVVIAATVEESVDAAAETDLPNPRRFLPSIGTSLRRGPGAPGDDADRHDSSGVRSRHGQLHSCTGRRWASTASTRRVPSRTSSCRRRSRCAARQPSAWSGPVSRISVCQRQSTRRPRPRRIPAAWHEPPPRGRRGERGNRSHAGGLPHPTRWPAWCSAGPRGPSVGWRTAPAARRELP
jgi:hypothetical protein